MIARRSIITGLVALVAAPAIVKVSSLMPVNAALQPNNSLSEWAQGAGRLFLDSNDWMQDTNAHHMVEMNKDGELTMRHVSDYEFYKGEQHSVDVLYGSTGQNLSSDDVKSLMERQYDTVFAADGAKIDDRLRIRLPNDYIVGKVTPPVPVALGPLALAAAAVAVAPVLLEKPVTRRFWSK